jgi:hypothetical protein
LLVAVEVLVAQTVDPVAELVVTEQIQDLQ